MTGGYYPCVWARRAIAGPGLKEGMAVPPIEKEMNE